MPCNARNPSSIWTVLFERRLSASLVQLSARRWKADLSQSYRSEHQDQQDWNMVYTRRFAYSLLNSLSGLFASPLILRCAEGCTKCANCSCCSWIRESKAATCSRPCRPRTCRWRKCTWPRDAPNTGADIRPLEQFKMVAIAERLDPVLFSTFPISSSISFHDTFSHLTSCHLMCDSKYHNISQLRNRCCSDLGIYLSKRSVLRKNPSLNKLFLLSTARS